MKGYFTKFVVYIQSNSIDLCSDAHVMLYTHCRVYREKYLPKKNKIGEARILGYFNSLYTHERVYIISECFSASVKMLGSTVELEAALIVNIMPNFKALGLI